MKDKKLKQMKRDYMKEFWGKGNLSTLGYCGVKTVFYRENYPKVSWLNEV